MEINLLEFTEEDKKQFVKSWEAAGGYIGDYSDYGAWCRPWEYTDRLVFNSIHPKEDLGKEYFLLNKNAILDELYNQYTEN